MTAPGAPGRCAAVKDKICLRCGGVVAEVDNAAQVTAGGRAAGRKVALICRRRLGEPCLATIATGKHPVGRSAGGSK